MNSDYSREGVRTRIIRLPEVKDRTGLGRSSIYSRISDGEFPESISLGGRAVGWIEGEIDDWLVGRIEASRKPGDRRCPTPTGVVRPGSGAM